MDVIFLVMQGPLVLPRRARIVARPGEGRTTLRSHAPLAPEWQASVARAVGAARRLTRCPQADVEVTLPGSTALEGVSAGLPIGLGVVAVLAGELWVPHFSTGGVLDETGLLVGGIAAGAKADAAASLARGLGWIDPPFLIPAGAPLPLQKGIRAVHAATLAEACNVLAQQSQTGSRMPASTSRATSASASTSTSERGASG